MFSSLKIRLLDWWWVMDMISSQENLHRPGISRLVTRRIAESESRKLRLFLSSELKTSIIISLFLASSSYYTFALEVCSQFINALLFVYLSFLSSATTVPHPSWPVIMLCFIFPLRSSSFAHIINFLAIIYLGIEYECCYVACI